MRIGIICPSEIAFRRFLPALSSLEDVIFSGVGIAQKNELFGGESLSQADYDRIRKKEYEKAQAIVDSFGGEIFDSYESIVSDKRIDAVYIPLPPGLHFYWAKKALENNKHVLIEKPSTTSYKDTKEMVDFARNKSLALHENYMFVYHNQIAEIKRMLDNGLIGDIRLFRLSFGFPLRQANDFRYNKNLGGGALYDAAGYTVKLAQLLLGYKMKVLCSTLNSIDGFEVDMFGSATFINNDKQTMQVAFGMDNDYRCELEVWGSKGTIVFNRVLTAPAGFVPTAILQRNGDKQIINMPSDDSFKKSILEFIKCIKYKKARNSEYKMILKQSFYIDCLLSKSLK